MVVLRTRLNISQTFKCFYDAPSTEYSFKVSIIWIFPIIFSFSSKIFPLPHVLVPEDDDAGGQVAQDAEHQEQPAHGIIIRNYIVVVGGK